MKMNQRFLECEYCEREIEKSGGDEFDWIDGAGPYCALCYRWQSQITALKKRIDQLEEDAQKQRGTWQSHGNMRQASNS